MAGDNAVAIRKYWISNAAPALRHVMSPYLKSFFVGGKGTGGKTNFVPLTDQQADQIFGKIRPEIVFKRPIKKGKIRKADRFAVKFGSEFTKVYYDRIDDKSRISI